MTHMPIRFDAWNTLKHDAQIRARKRCPCTKRSASACGGSMASMINVHLLKNMA